MNAGRREFLRTMGRIGAVGALTTLAARLALCRRGGADGQPLPCSACGLRTWCPDSKTPLPVKPEGNLHA